MSVEEEIYYAVRSAIWKGMSPEDFKRAANESWQICLREDAEKADKEFSKE